MRESYIYKRIRPTPKLTPENMATRKDFCVHVLSGPARNRHTMWTDCVDIDEKIFKIPGYYGKVRVHPDSDVEDDDDYDQIIHPRCQSKRFIPGIMVTAAVTRPLCNQQGKCIKSGLVGIWRNWDEEERKTNRYEYAIDEETGEKTRVGFIYKKGEAYMKDKNVDAQFHHKMMTTKILPAIRKFHGDGKRKLKFKPACQQDGAGGHGTKSNWSYKIEQDAKKKKPQIFFHTQPANSPCLNLCDLGLWPMITSHLIHKKPKNIEEMWEYIQEAFWAIDQESLDNMCHQKSVMCVQIAKADGGYVPNDLHTGYRAPTWAEMRKYGHEKTRWVYEYENPKE